MNGLFGFNVTVSSALVGSKRAVRMGNTICVSPAMFDLIKHANEDELQRLLAAINVLTIPEPPSIYGPLPMITKFGD